MDSLKKIIHPHKTDHHSHDSTAQSTATNSQHGNVLTGSETGDNIANPFTEHNTTAAEHFRRHNAATTTTTTTTEPNVVTDHPRHPPAGETPLGQNSDHHHRGAGAGAGVGVGVGAPIAAGGPAGDEHVPGVNTGGARVVEARMPVEEGNNFPGTNPHPAHSALGGPGAGGGLKYPGGE